MCFQTRHLELNWQLIRTKRYGAGRGLILPNWSLLSHLRTNSTALPEMNSPSGSRQDHGNTQVQEQTTTFLWWKLCAHGTRAKPGFRQKHQINSQQDGTLDLHVASKALYHLGDVIPFPSSISSPCPSSSRGSAASGKYQTHSAHGFINES